MWLITTRGFYSVVEHRDDPDVLLVRARAREDLEALSPLIPDLEIVEHAGSDYRFRASVARGDWQEVLEQLTAEIDYGNFKNAVATRVGRERAATYGDVWGTLMRLQYKR